MFPGPRLLEATRAAQSADADLLISFGGGTPNDTAKLVALCLAENVTDEAPTRPLPYPVPVS